ncbi:MAG: viologen exporter family transport system permease protein [Fimbriimonadaceae bacterium]|jgi:ABC-2 type transport system permease protein|nr:viologen exporter family transport system permease protein [Fimbriimonadaceae bacterium]
MEAHATSPRTFLVLATYRKLRAIFTIYLRECFAYPAASFIWVLADAQTALILPAVWLASSHATTIVGMAPSELITYYIGSMVLSQFITCHLMWDMAWDMREGEFSGHLLRPFSYFRMNLARNFAWRATKLVLFLPVGVLAYLVYRPVGMAPVHFSAEFFLAVLLGQMLSYVSAFCVAMTALWTTEFMSTFRMYYLPEMFLSGRLIPLSALPAWALGISTWTHFRYMNFFPVEMLLGKLSPAEVWHGLAIQMAWIVVFLLLGRVMFKHGVRQYTGAGN